MRWLAFALVSLSIFIGGCSDASTQKVVSEDNPATKAARLEAEFQQQTDANGVMRSEARQTVSDFVRTNLSTWNVKGMSCEVFAQNSFAIDADLERNGQHTIITLYTERFFPESGDPYWVAIPVNKLRRERLHRLSDEDLIKQLDKVRNQLEDLQSPPDDDR